MGHTRLGSVPKTRKWRELVQQLAGPTLDTREIATPFTDVGSVASWTLDAAQKGLKRAVSDPGVRYTFFLLTQVALASRSTDWKRALAGLGIRLNERSSVFDLAAEIQRAVDQHLRRTATWGSDIGEMAQQAAGEAISCLAGPLTQNLFDTTGAEIQSAIRSLSTKKGFGELGQKFFGRFVARFLNFYLSRITAAGLGSSQIQQLGDITTFNETLRLHCDQSARIVRDFSGEWYSKTEYQEGIDQENSSKFLAVALRKLSAELEKQKADS